MSGGKTEDTAGPTEPVLPAELPGLHLGQVLERIGISAEIFRSILLKFAEGNGQKDKELLQLLDRGDQKGFALLCHTLKGAAASIGAVSLQEACLAVEVAAKEAKDADEIRALVDEVSRALEVVMTSLATLR